MVYSIKTRWQPNGPVLESLKLLLDEIRQNCPSNYRIADMGLISSADGLEVVVYFQET